MEIEVLSERGFTIELQQHKSAISNNPPEGKTFLQHGIFKFGVSVTDVRAAVTTLKNCGATVVIEPFDDNNAKTVMAVIKDDSANLIQLIQMRR